MQLDIGSFIGNYSWYQPELSLVTKVGSMDPTFNSKSLICLSQPCLPNNQLTIVTAIQYHYYCYYYYSIKIIVVRPSICLSVHYGRPAETI